uniref:Uncharacterized protein n=1 Tax=Arundo donax TaxID=35708 RepID=A0A0A9FPW9_ARUDO
MASHIYIHLQKDYLLFGISSSCRFFLFIYHVENL